MQELTLFYLQRCPHCKRAIAYMEELYAENPAYGDIPLRKIEEVEQKELADSYDYYYVPCFYIGEEKVSEGSVDKAAVKDVLDRALSS